MRNIHRETANYAGGIGLYAPSDYRSNIPIPIGVKGTANGWKSYYWDMTGPYDYSSDGDHIEHTETSAGTTATAANVLFSNAMTLTLDATDNDTIHLQWIEPLIALSKTKDWYLETELEVTSGTIVEQVWFVGLTSDQQTTGMWADPAVALVADDHLGWSNVLVSTGTIDFNYAENDSSSRVETGQLLVTAVSVKLGAHFQNAKGIIDLYENDVLVNSHAVSPANLPTSELGLSIKLENEAATASDLSVRYLTLAVEL